VARTALVALGGPIRNAKVVDAFAFDNTTSPLLSVVSLEFANNVATHPPFSPDHRQMPPIVGPLPLRFPRGTKIEDVLRDVGRACFAQFVLNIPAGLAGSPEAIHQMRLAIRRLRSALTTVKPVLAVKAYAAAQNKLKELAIFLDTSRNWDVFAEDILGPVVEDLPENKSIKRLAKIVDTQREFAHRQIRNFIIAPKTVQTIVGLSRWFEANDWRDKGTSRRSALILSPLCDHAPALLGHRLRQVRRLSRKFASRSLADRHRLRIGLKKLDYAVELCSSFYDNKEVKGYVKPLRKLRKQLGYVSDIRTAGFLVSQLEQAADSHVPQRAAEIVMGWHERKLAEKEEELRKKVYRFRKLRPFWC